MREAGLQGVSRRKSTGTTRRDRTAPAAPDLVDRDFAAAGPDALWVADITYVPTWSGFLYLAVVLDAWSRRVVGWAMATHLRTQLVLDALDMALHRRRPKKVIHHSDHGSQYKALAFGQRCRQAGVRPSMGSVGDCYDNALCESFFATLERELLDAHRFATQAEAQLTVFRVPGRLVQPPSATLRPGTTISDQLREVSLIEGYKSKRKTVREIGVTSVCCGLADSGRCRLSNMRSITTSTTGS